MPRLYDELEAHNSAAVKRLLADIRKGGEPKFILDPNTGWDLCMDDHNAFYPLYGASEIVNALLEALSADYRSVSAEHCDPMSDDRALEEIGAAKAVLQRHYDAGFLLGFWHEQYDGFQYRYADGQYARRAEIEAEDAAKAA